MDFYIRSREAAQAIIDAYRHCSNCSDCILDMPEGWKCSYLYDRAVRYLENHPEEV